jgi:hypothetical protein
MADTYGDPMSKRPAPTIEGTATEVSVEPAEDEAPSAAPGLEAEPSEREDLADEPESLKGPPPRTSQAELKSFFTHLAAGLLGGLVGVVALAVAWQLIPLRDAAPPNLAPIEARLAKLEEAPPPATANDDSGAVAALAARVKTLEERKVETPQELSDLTARVTRLEETLNALAETAKDGGSVADAAALDAKFGDLEQKLQGKIDSAIAAERSAEAPALESLQSQVAALTAKLGALAEANLNGDGPDVGPQLAGLGQRIGKLEAALPALSTAIDSSAASAKSGAAALAFGNLRAAVAGGRPYAAELAAMRSLMPQPIDLGGLAAHADTGIPRVPELARSFAGIAESRAASAPPPAPADTSFLDSMIASAKSVVSIRRVGEAAPESESEAGIARAKAALDQRNLAAAVKEVEALPASERAAYAQWLDQARARLSANATLNTLESTVLAGLAAPATPSDAAPAPEAKP